MRLPVVPFVLSSVLYLAIAGCRDQGKAPLITSAVSLVELDTVDLNADESSLCSSARAAKDDAAMCAMLRQLKGPIAKGILAFQAKQTTLYEFPVFRGENESGNVSPRIGVGPFENLAACQLALEAARSQSLDTGPCRLATLPTFP